MEFGQKFFCEIDLFDFTNFFGLNFFNFLAYCALACRNREHTSKSVQWRLTVQFKTKSSFKLLKFIQNGKPRLCPAKIQKLVENFQLTEISLYYPHGKNDNS